jgi:hypothetical protein
MRTRPIKFDDDKIQAWTYDGSEPGTHTLTSAIALSGLEDTMIRLSSALQIRLLGHNLFGKQHFMLRKDGTYLVSRKVCFGTDFESRDGQQAELSVASRNQQTIRPGWSRNDIFQDFFQ